MGSAFARVQRVGLSLLFPIAVLPAAGLLLRLGQPDVLGQLGWLQAIHVPAAISGAGNGIFAHLPLLFAIGVAVGLSEGNAGAAALAAAVGYLVFQGLLIAVYPAPGSADTVSPKVDTGVVGGIAIGLIAAYMYNNFRNVRLPDFLAFFGGRRFVPIITSFAALGAGIVAWIVWPPINDNVINPAGTWMSTSGVIGAGVYGIVNRLLLPLGLHHIPNTLLWFSVGSYTAADGHVYHGDLNRFFHGDPSAGIFMTGYFPVMMFGLPAAALAIYHSAQTRRRKAIAGLLLSAALTSFVTGITEPIEYSFLFVAPVLYGVHVLLTGLSLVITNLAGMHLGFSFSAGAIDYLLYWGLEKNQLLLFVIGPIYAVVYYVVFRGLIHVLDLKTPGREPEILDEEVGEGDLAGDDLAGDDQVAPRPVPAQT